MSQELLYRIALTLVPHVGAVSAKNLISHCGSVEAVFENSKRALLKIPGVGTETAQAIVQQDVFSLAEREMEFIAAHEIRTFYYLDNDYPRRLKNLPDCPVLLYYKGNADLDSNRMVGVIGTRKPSAPGLKLCEELVADLHPFNITLLSGLAYGIDVAAHKKSVELNIPTIGVLGHGLSMIYPSTHRKVAEEMLEQGGLLTEFAHTYGPDAPHFPMRNRIVAGLCDALVVVETRKRGGSMITASLANRYRKDVFAVPGRIKDKESEGCNLLIKSHKATLLDSTKDLASAMKWAGTERKKSVQTSLFVELNENQQNIIGYLKNMESMHVDQLSSQTTLSNSKMASELLELEFKGLIKSMPGKRYLLL